MKELQEGDAKGDNVKGTNLSPEELGMCFGTEVRLTGRAIFNLVISR